jgi:hypothetical protein
MLPKSETPIDFSLYNAEINDLEINNRTKTEYSIKTCEPIQLGLLSSSLYPIQAASEPSPTHSPFSFDRQGSKLGA